jgi:hypothetical protein
MPPESKQSLERGCVGKVNVMQATIGKGAGTVMVESSKDGVVVGTSSCNFSSFGDVSPGDECYCSYHLLLLPLVGTFSILF